MSGTASPPLEDFPSELRPASSNFFPQRTPPPKVARSTPTLPGPSELLAAPRSAPKFPLHARAGGGEGGRAETAASGRVGPAPAGPPSSFGPPRPLRRECRPRPPHAPRPPSPPTHPPLSARSPRRGRAPVTCRAPGGLLLPSRHAARAAAAVASAAAGVRGRRARAQLRGAPNFGLVPAGSGLRARRGSRGAARMDGRARGRSGGGGGGRAGRVPAAGLRAERAGPGRRTRSHPRRGPRAQRRALGGPARGPRSMPPPPAAALLLAGAPPGAAPGAALLLPPRAESLRAQLSLPSVLAVRGSRRVFLVRGSQLSHCAPARPIQAVLFLLHLV